jgi:hypothetical protein
MKKALLASILALSIGSAYAMTMTTYPQSTQTDTESDRQSAIDTATQNAQNWAASQCIGNVTNSQVINQGAVNLGDSDNPSWLATVTVRDTCVFTR